MLIERDDIIRAAMDAMQQELDKIQTTHANEVRTMVERHNVLISEIKKKQWVSLIR